MNKTKISLNKIYYACLCGFISIMFGLPTLANADDKAYVDIKAPSFLHVLFGKEDPKDLLEVAKGEVPVADYSQITARDLLRMVPRQARQSYQERLDREFVIPVGTSESVVLKNLLRALSQKEMAQFLTNKETNLKAAALKYWIKKQLAWKEPTIREMNDYIHTVNETAYRKKYYEVILDKTIVSDFDSLSDEDLKAMSRQQNSDVYLEDLSSKIIIPVSCHDTELLEKIIEISTPEEFREFLSYKEKKLKKMARSFIKRKHLMGKSPSIEEVNKKIRSANEHLYRVNLVKKGNYYFEGAFTLNAEMAMSIMEDPIMDVLDKVSPNITPKSVFNLTADVLKAWTIMTIGNPMWDYAEHKVRQFEENSGLLAVTKDVAGPIVNETGQLLDRAYDEAKDVGVNVAEDTAMKTQVAYDLTKENFSESVREIIQKAKDGNHEEIKNQYDFLNLIYQKASSWFDYIRYDHKTMAVLDILKIESEDIGPRTEPKTDTNKSRKSPLPLRILKKAEGLFSIGIGAAIRFYAVDGEIYIRIAPIYDQRRIVEFKTPFAYVQLAVLFSANFSPSDNLNSRRTRIKYSAVNAFEAYQKEKPGGSLVIAFSPLPTGVASWVEGEIERTFLTRSHPKKIGPKLKKAIVAGLTTTRAGVKTAQTIGKSVKATARAAHKTYSKSISLCRSIFADTKGEKRTKKKKPKRKKNKQKRTKPKKRKQNR